MSYTSTSQEEEVSIAKALFVLLTRLSFVRPVLVLHCHAADFDSFYSNRTSAGAGIHPLDPGALRQIAGALVPVAAAFFRRYFPGIQSKSC